MQQVDVIKVIALLCILFLSVNCKEKQKTKEKISYSNKERIKKDLNPLPNREYASTFSVDTTIQKKNIDLIYLNSGIKKDSLISFCSCEKNVKRNMLKIQLRIGFPPKSELEKGKTGNRMPLESPLPIQYRLLTFHLKDSIVKKAIVLAASTERQFNGRNIDSFSIKKYHLNITKFNYKIAQDIWGSYTIILDKDFGYFKNDTIIKGTFHCNNWKIQRYKDLEKWIHLKPKKNLGFIVE